MYLQNRLTGKVQMQINDVTIFPFLQNQIAFLLSPTTSLNIYFFKKMFNFFLAYVHAGCNWFQRSISICSLNLEQTRGNNLAN